jgi:S-phase kinase-associated protein 1
MDFVTLVSSNQDEFVVEKALVSQSRLIRNMLEDLDMSGGIIPLPNVTSDILKLGLLY